MSMRKAYEASSEDSTKSKRRFKDKLTAAKDKADDFNKGLDTKENKINELER